MAQTLTEIMGSDFLGRAPRWYKATIIGFLALNPLVFFSFGDLGPMLAGWLLVGEIIFTLAMALHCYPLPAGGLLVIEALFLGLTTPDAVGREVMNNFPVILLLMFMVAGIYFLKDVLLYTFTKLLLGVRSKLALAVAFCITAAFLSAFLDALTVVAVVLAVAGGFHQIYAEVVTGRPVEDLGAAEHHRPDAIALPLTAEVEDFRGFLRDLLMHAAVGTALGGVCTLVGEPQNLLIGTIVGWNFGDFFFNMAPVSLPVFAVGLLTCVAVEKWRLFGYGTELPQGVRRILEGHGRRFEERLTMRERYRLAVQGIVALTLVVALALHLAEVGLIGLMVIILATAFNGVVDEHRIGKAFQEALPFTALLVVFFAVVAVIHTQHLFAPVINHVLAIEGEIRYLIFYLANGALSAISDNVFVATIYIREVEAAFNTGLIGREEFEKLAVAINTGTNIPSIATPNGQAAFLFLLTSGFAVMIRLTYLRMVWMALPYTVTMTTTGMLATVLFL